METVIIEEGEAGSLHCGVVRLGTYHYFDLPAELTSKEAIERWFADKAASSGKAEVQYTISYAPSADRILA